MDTCSVAGCDRPVAARTWCIKHYKRWWATPEPRPDEPPPIRQPRLCIDCGAVRAANRCRECARKHRWGDVAVEEAERYGIKFRRYPESDNPAHRRYFRPGMGDTTKGVDALHREVHKREIGPIPDGWHVHHRDSDINNNEPANLVALPPGEHLAITLAGWKERGGSWRDRDAQVAHLASIRGAAAEWHSSDEGRAWHREHAKTSLRRAGVQSGDG